MTPQELREDCYAKENWRKQRPFFCRLCPEYIHEDIRDHLLEEVTEELQAQKRRHFAYDTYFTYPSDEQMSFQHERFRKTGLFFSEIRETVGYRAAEALATLAGMLRLEPSGAGRNLLHECFVNLWNEFSAHAYGRGFRTSNVRATLVATLASNNVFSLVAADDKWKAMMRDYFENDKHDWSQAPLRGIYPHIIKLLGGTTNAVDSDNPILTGRLDIAAHADEVESFCRALLWEQGEPENDSYLPGVMLSGQRRGDSEAPSDYFLTPFHLIRIECGPFWDIPATRLHGPFDRIAMSFWLSLDLRTRIVSHMGTVRTFTIDDAVHTLKADRVGIQAAVGQMIKIGLADFDRLSGRAWNSPEQEYVCTADAVALLGR